MNDALQWIIDLMTYDFGRLTVGILVLLSLIEVLGRLREWINE